MLDLIQLLERHGDCAPEGRRAPGYSGEVRREVMMKVRLFMIVFKNYSRLGACMHTANHPEGDTPRDH